MLLFKRHQCPMSSTVTCVAIPVRLSGHTSNFEANSKQMDEYRKKICVAFLWGRKLSSEAKSIFVPRYKQAL